MKTFTRSISTSFHGSKNRREVLIKEAEKVVGYPTSFLSLRWILNDEIANIAQHIRKLIGTNHPLLKIAKSLLLRDEQATWGLIVLLISKIAGLNSNFSEIECDRTADILHSQRIVAEVTEMIKTSHLIHKGLINIKIGMEYSEDLSFGNKLALLCGDYLLSTSFSEIAKLKNNQVQETISSTLRDLSEAEFLGMRDSQNKAIPSKPLPVQETIEIPLILDGEPFPTNGVLGNMQAEWTMRNILSGGSLLGKCCQCSLILANHNEASQKLAYIFGRNLALAWQASLEKNLLFEENFSLISAPVMLHLEYDADLYKEIEKDPIEYEQIREIVSNGPALDRTTQLQKKFANEALNVLQEFPASNSKTALINIINSL